MLKRLLLLSAVPLALGGCFEPTSQQCSSGVVFAVGTRCSADGKSCVPDADLCGNHVIDPGEMCDDGNTLSGDGCSSDCKSNEICGNGVTDTQKGEVCDDGNTKSGDGCNATCTSLERCG